MSLQYWPSNPDPQTKPWSREQLYFSRTTPLYGRIATLPYPNWPQNASASSVYSFGVTNWYFIPSSQLYTYLVRQRLSRPNSVFLNGQRSAAILGLRSALACLERLLGNLVENIWIFHVVLTTRQPLLLLLVLLPKTGCFSYRLPVVSKGQWKADSDSTVPR